MKTYEETKTCESYLVIMEKVENMEKVNFNFCVYGMPKNLIYLVTVLNRQS